MNRVLHPLKSRDRTPKNYIVSFCDAFCDETVLDIGAVRKPRTLSKDIKWFDSYILQNKVLLASLYTWMWIASRRSSHTDSFGAMTFLVFTRIPYSFRYIVDDWTDVLLFLVQINRTFWPMSFMNESIPWTLSYSPELFRFSKPEPIWAASKKCLKRQGFGTGSGAYLKVLLIRFHLKVQEKVQVRCLSILKCDMRSTLAVVIFKQLVKTILLCCRFYLLLFLPLLLLPEADIGLHMIQSDTLQQGLITSPR